jgi:hypothetical protein
MTTLPSFLAASMVTVWPQAYRAVEPKAKTMPRPKANLNNPHIALEAIESTS